MERKRVFDDRFTGVAIGSAIVAGLMWLLLLANLTGEASEGDLVPRIGAAITLALVAVVATVTVVVLLSPG